MPKGIPNSGSRVSNPNPGKAHKCNICGVSISYGRRLRHNLLHSNKVLCEVSGCNKKYTPGQTAKRKHYELMHELECLTNGQNFRHIVSCDLPLEDCHICRKLVTEGKARYKTRHPQGMKRHKSRAAVKSGNQERIKCLVVDVVKSNDGSVNEVPCNKTFADKESLRRHHCGGEGGKPPHKAEAI